MLNPYEIQASWHHLPRAVMSRSIASVSHSATCRAKSETISPVVPNSKSLIVTLSRDNESVARQRITCPALPRFVCAVNAPVSADISAYRQRRRWQHHQTKHYHYLFHFIHTRTVIASSLAVTMPAKLPLPLIEHRAAAAAR